MKPESCKKDDVLIKNNCIPKKVLRNLRKTVLHQLTTQRKEKRHGWIGAWESVASPDTKVEKGAGKKSNWRPYIDEQIFPYVDKFAKNKNIIPVNSCQGHKGTEWGLPFISIIVTDSEERKRLKKFAKKHVDVIDDKKATVTYLYRPENKKYEIPIFSMVCKNRNKKAGCFNPILKYLEGSI